MSSSAKKNDIIAVLGLGKNCVSENSIFYAGRIYLTYSAVSSSKYSPTSSLK
jgi:hypothetical protein